jgi:putative hydrolase
MKLNRKQDFHVHSNYNDHSSADLTIAAIRDHAMVLELETLAITEHVRRSSNWIPKYLKEINLYNSPLKRKEYGKECPEIITGFEAKILRDGSIDCPDEYSRDFFLIASFHTIYGDKSIWLNALKMAIQNPDVTVLGHLAPEPTFRLERSELEEIADEITSNNKIVELNAKYRRPPVDWISLFKQKGVRFHLASDAHSLNEIGQFSNISDLISLVEDSTKSNPRSANLLL